LRREDSYRRHNDAQDLALASIAIEADDGLKGLRCYVPRRPEVRHGWPIDMEVLRDALLIGASDVAATHEDSLANQVVEPKRLTPDSPN
jgi:hypothetical protein